MKRATHGLAPLALAFSVALLVAGCQDDAAPTAPEATVPAPQTVAASAIAEPVDRPPTADDPDALYYLLLDGQSAMAERAAKEGAAAVLEDLMARGFALEEAWFPVQSSVVVPCGVQNAYEALVVELAAPDEAIERLGFMRDPRPNTPNCGVEAFAYYRFG